MPDLSLVKDWARPQSPNSASVLRWRAVRHWQRHLERDLTRGEKTMCTGGSWAAEMGEWAHS
jgi:hypothetical protein